MEGGVESGVGETLEKSPPITLKTEEGVVCQGM
jgi:hypothetical protein